MNHVLIQKNFVTVRLQIYRSYGEFTTNKMILRFLYQQFDRLITLVLCSESYRFRSPVSCGSRGSSKSLLENDALMPYFGSQTLPFTLFEYIVKCHMKVRRHVF
jgi:hypothetical protein